MDRHFADDTTETIDAPTPDVVITCAIDLALELLDEDSPHFTALLEVLSS